MKTNPVCRVCDVELTDENWYPSDRKGNNHICKNCHIKQTWQWQKSNPDKRKAIWRRRHRKQGQRPMNENRECSQYLGVYVAEGVLSQAFKDVQKMPMSNPGFDFICNKGKKIDVKSSCKKKNRNGWGFHIDKNQIADYFLCLAFDNREDLNPMHVWLIPGDVLNHLISATISLSTIHKWDEYQLDVTKVATCCNAMRSDSQ